MISLSLAAHRNRTLTLHPLEIEIAGRRIAHSQTLDFGPPFGSLPVRELAQAAERFERLSAGTCRPQLAALLFGLTAQPRALDWYFPLTRILSSPIGAVSTGGGREGVAAFDSLREQIADHPNFDLRLIAEDLRDVTSFMPSEVRALAAGHLAEVFFFRPDLLERFLAAPRHFALYTSPQAYAADGGQAGGQYHSDRECVQLVLSRLFEGFNGETPGVCPFLHEFGHMLDFFDAGSGRMRRESSGLLPGLHPADGDPFSPQARSCFLKGKRLEHDRYMGRYLGYAAPSDPFPIGHPYVFRSDSEFIAGYFEMFFRNPNYFAGMNPDLFEAFAITFGYDPRPAWPSDFPFYVAENRKFYASGERPWKPGLTLSEK